MSLSPGTFIVTGAAGGLGRAVAEIYSKGNHPYTGIFTVRDGSTQSAHDLQKLLSSSGKSLTTAVVDLSDLSSVRKFASDIKTKVQSGELKPIRALLLNAGTQDITGMKFTSDGLEHTFVVNYLANVLLVLLLLPSIDRENGRIVFVSSSAHDPTHWLNKNFKPDAIAWKEPGELARPTVPDQEGDERNAGLRRYGTSKLWLLMFMYELQRRLDATPTLRNISTISINPGAVGNTGLTRNHNWVIRVLVGSIMTIAAIVSQYFEPNGEMRTASQSANDFLSACFSQEGEIFSQRPKAIYLNGKARIESSEESKDVDKQKLLWKASLEFVDLKEEDLALEKQF